MRLRVEGTRASREGEPYSQDANVTDAAMVRRNCRTEETRIPCTPPTVGDSGGAPSNAPDNDDQGVWEQREGGFLMSLPPQLNDEIQESGNLNALPCNEDRAKPGPPGEGRKTAPTAAQHLRHEQRRNLDQLPQGSGG